MANILLKLLEPQRRRSEFVAAGRHRSDGEYVPAGGVAGHAVRRGGAARPADRRGRHADGVHGGRVPAVEPAGCLLRRRGAPHPARQPQPARHARRALLLLAVLPAAAAARRQVRQAAEHFSTFSHNIVTDTDIGQNFGQSRVHVTSS